ncbi:hypothetical protein [Actinotalea sp. K2]|uniref:hypothetical protein n=1 Tax=Actinotalea sp. K2 TaxID=2939438 RepID=UPI002017C02A|nr:hypothetical protein [Actinotalea sp. K2]MCL3860353.1 hypothetical protein [Actinotalea sp. K2]
MHPLPLYDAVLRDHAREVAQRAREQSWARRRRERRQPERAGLMAALRAGTRTAGTRLVRGAARATSSAPARPAAIERSAAPRYVLTA